MDQSDHSRCKDRMMALFQSSIDKFERAGDFMEKDPNNLIQRSSVKGVIQKAYSELEEAILNAEQAFESAETIDEIKQVKKIGESLAFWIESHPTKFSELDKYEGRQVLELQTLLDKFMTSYLMSLKKIAVK